MGRAVYVVVGREGEWSVEHDGKLSGPYVSKEAAFEAAVGPASLSIHDGDSVVIEVPGKTSRDEPLLGETATP